MDECAYIKTIIGFGYRGNLEDCIAKAKEDVAKLEKETPLRGGK